MTGKWLQTRIARRVDPRRLVRILLSALCLAFLTTLPPSLARPIRSLREADALVPQKEFTRALDLYTSLTVSLDPSMLDVRIGNVYLQRRQLDEAEKYFRQALGLADPHSIPPAGIAKATDAAAWLGQGLVDFERDDYNGAASAFREALKDNSSDLRPKILYHLGLAYLQSLDSGRARDAFAATIAARPRDTYLAAEAHYGLGLADLTSDVAAANSDFARVLQLAGRPVGGDVCPSSTANSTAEVSTGACPDVASVAQVMQKTTKDLETAPTDEASKSGIRGAQHDALLGQALLQVGEPRLAAAFLEKAVGLRPDYAEAKADLGYAYWLEGRQDEAGQVLREALELDPRLVLGHYFMGIVSRGQQRLPEAIREFTTMIQLDDTSVEGYVELANTQAMASQYADAGDNFERAMRLQPNDIRAKLTSVWFHLDHLFDVGRGLEIAREATKLAPSNAEAQDALGWALYVNGQTEEAEASLRRAIALAPFTAQPHFHLAVALAMRGDVRDAAVEYRRAADLDGGGNLGVRAAAALEALARNR